MIRYTVRFPGDLYDQLKAAAERDHRSIHAEVLWLLERALTDEGRTKRAR